MILLDTQVFFWSISNLKKLSASAQKIIAGEIKDSRQILISAISVWEIYMLVKKGRLELSIDVNTWMHKTEKLSHLQFIPIDNLIASKSVMLPEPLHGDPADRFIVATALEYGATLITSDKQLLKYPHVRSLW